MDLDLDDFRSWIKKYDGAVVFFTASWCEPCKEIYPVFDDIQKIAPANMGMIKIDVKKSQDVSDYCSIKKMPTFHFYYKGKLDASFVGANAKNLEVYYNKLLSKIPEVSD